MAQRLPQTANGKSHYVIIVALHPGTEQGSAALDAIGTGLVHGFAGGYICFNFLVRQRPEMQVGDLGKGFAAAVGNDGAAGHHLMVPAGQQLQHFHRLLMGVGFAQNLPLADHNGVRRHHNVPRLPGQGQGFAPTDPGHLVKGRFLGVHGFINIRRPDHKGDAEQAQQFFPPG